MVLVFQLKLLLGVDVALATGEIPPRWHFWQPLTFSLHTILFTGPPPARPIHHLPAAAAACGPPAAVAGWIVKWLTVAPAMRIVSNVRWREAGFGAWGEEGCISACLTLDVMTV